MGLFERYLTVWVGLGILAGVGLGLLTPATFAAIAALEVAHVNLVVAVLIWIMIYPMMIQIDFAAVRDVGKRPQGLLLTVVLLFGFQAPTIVARPLVIGLIAIPLLIQTYGIFAIGYAGARWLKLPHNIAAPACLIGTSNFFELAVAVAISLFGMQSGAALATVVGVLVEVPVMLSLVALINRTPHWFEPSA